MNAFGKKSAVQIEILRNYLGVMKNLFNVTYVHNMQHFVV